MTKPYSLVMVDGPEFYAILQGLTGKRRPLFNILNLRRMWVQKPTPKHYTRYYLVDKDGSEDPAAGYLEGFQKSLRRSYWWVTVKESTGGLEMAIKCDAMVLLKRHGQGIKRLVLVAIKNQDIMFLVDEAHEKNVPVTIVLDNQSCRGLERSSLRPDDEIIQIKDILPQIILPDCNGRVQNTEVVTKAVDGNGV